MSHTAIEKAIEALFSLYVEHPLRLLREIGLQARLATLIQERLETKFCSARVIDLKKNCYETTDTIERVQMETCIEVPDLKNLEATDLVVLRHDTNAPVDLKLYPNGHLDIVSKISAQAVEAAIEIKASCSADLRERHKFRCDVAKLLSLASRVNSTAWKAPSMHFVLVDKSLAVGGHGSSASMRREGWSTEPDDQVERLTTLGRQRYWEQTPRIQLSDAEPVDRPFVQVWTLATAPNGSASGRVTHQYATAA